MRFRMLVPAVAVAAVLVLVGCAPGDPIIAPEPEPETPPVFASDEEALAAATEAYAEYVLMSDSIFHNGGMDASELSEILTGKLLDATLEGFEEARVSNIHSVGQTTFDQVKLQRHDEVNSNDGIVVIYVCEDVSEVQVLNANGESVVSPDRPDRVLYEVTFDLSPSKSHLLVSNRVAWSSEPC